MADHWLCDDAVVAVADDIRKAFHEEIAEAEIAWVFIETAPQKGGTLRLGVAKKSSPLYRALAKVDFAIVISKDTWDDMSVAQRRALLDHELSHCAPKENKKGERVGWRTRRHDLEDFTSVVGRHGLLWSAQRLYIEAASNKQLELDLERACPDK